MNRTLGPGPILLAAILGLGVVAAVAAAEPIDFAYTGSEQSYNVPTDGSVCAVTLELIGASGGEAVLGEGGEGGSLKATLAISPGETLFITVGGAGGDGSGLGGFGGGADSGVASSGEHSSGGGGGASTVSNESIVLAVAGGGGGAGVAIGSGGSGGSAGGDGGDGTADAFAPSAGGAGSGATT
ncbi:MAG: glycine-rich protein, partial [Candidatus Binatia bacterium]